MEAIARTALLVYGILMIVGGILGYVLPKKPSKVSLIAGGASGVLAVAAFLIALYGERTIGLAIGLVVSAGVAVMMGPRIKKASKPTSTIMIIALSVVTAIIVLVALVQGS